MTCCLCHIPLRFSSAALYSYVNYSFDNRRSNRQYVSRPEFWPGERRKVPLPAQRATSVAIAASLSGRSQGLRRGRWLGHEERSPQEPTHERNRLSLTGSLSWERPPDCYGVSGSIRKAGSGKGLGQGCWCGRVIPRPRLQAGTLFNATGTAVPLVKIAWKLLKQGHASGCGREQLRLGAGRRAVVDLPDHARHT